MKNNKRIIFNNVRIDSVAIFSDNQVTVMPCPWEAAKGEKWISDGITDMLENLPNDERVMSDEQRATNAQSETLKGGSQLTNRQLVILFECLMGVTLNAQSTNIKALSRLLSKISGHAEGSIRSLINGGIYYDNKQTINDAKIVAELIKPIQPKLAEKLLNNIHEE